MNNERGFLASSVLYVMLGLFLILMIGVINIYSNRKALLDRIKEDIVRELEYGIEKEETVIIDNEAPKLAIIITEVSTNNISVIADASAISKIEKYEFNIDDGSWEDNDDIESYQFSDLAAGKNYKVCARVTSGSNKTSQVCKTVQTNS